MTKKILVVDDKAELRTLLKSYLAQEGFEVVTAGDGREALFVARQEKPDLILEQAGNRFDGMGGFGGSGGFGPDFGGRGPGRHGGMDEFQPVQPPDTQSDGGL